MDLSGLASEYLRAVEEAEARAAALKEASERVQAAEGAMFSAMVESELSSLTAEGFVFDIDVSTHYSCLADRRDALYEALKPYERDGIFKTTFSVHAGTLQATMREWEGQGGIPEEVKELLSVFDQPKLKVKKARK
jgi:hypothetical protein